MADSTLGDAILLLCPIENCERTSNNVLYQIHGTIILISSEKILNIFNLWIQGTFFDANKLAKHVARHRGNKKFICTVEKCGAAFSSQRTLANHVGAAHIAPLDPVVGLPFGCNITGCKKRYSTVYALEYHLRTHAGVKPFICGCGKGFTKKQTLEYHQNEAKKPCTKKAAPIEPTEGPFACSHVGCDARFATQREYQQHFSAHVDEWMKLQDAAENATQLLAEEEIDASATPEPKRRKI